MADVVPAIFWRHLKGGEHEQLASLLSRSRAADETSSVLAGCRDAFGFGALHWAVYLGDEAAVRLLLAHGADVDAADEDGQTPLHIALANAEQRPTMARLLLTAGAAVVPPAGSDEGYLHVACSAPAAERDSSDVARLCDKGAPLTAVDGQGLTPLHCAAYHGRRAAVRYLLRALTKRRLLGVALNHHACNRTPLMLAVLNSRHDVVRLLLDCYTTGKPSSEHGRRRPLTADDDNDDDDDDDDAYDDEGGDDDDDDDDDDHDDDKDSENKTNYDSDDDGDNDRQKDKDEAPDLNVCDADGATVLDLAVRSGQQALVGQLTKLGARPGAVPTSHRHDEPSSDAGKSERRQRRARQAAAKLPSVHASLRIAPASRSRRPRPDFHFDVVGQELGKQQATSSSSMPTGARRKHAGSVAVMTSRSTTTQRPTQSIQLTQSIQSTQSTQPETTQSVQSTQSTQPETTQLTQPETTQSTQESAVERTKQDELFDFFVQFQRQLDVALTESDNGDAVMQRQHHELTEELARRGSSLSELEAQLRGRLAAAQQQLAARACWSCLQRPSVCAVLPCGHLCWCGPCAGVQVRCPKCSQPAAGLVHIVTQH